MSDDILSPDGWAAALNAIRFTDDAEVRSSKAYTLGLHDAALRRQLAAAEAVLREVEWRGPQGRCPCCDIEPSGPVAKSLGLPVEDYHDAAGCKLAAALAVYPLATSR